MLLHPSKAYSSIWKEEVFGNVILSKLVHPEKVLVFNEDNCGLSPFSMVTD